MDFDELGKKVQYEMDKRFREETLGNEPFPPIIKVNHDVLVDDNPNIVEWIREEVYRLHGPHAIIEIVDVSENLDGVTIRVIHPKDSSDETVRSPELGAEPSGEREDTLGRSGLREVFGSGGILHQEGEPS